MNRVLVPVDGSFVSTRSIAVAAMLARITRSELALVRVQPLACEGGTEPLAARAVAVYLDRIAQSIHRAYGMATSQVMRTGNAADIIAQEAERAAWVVMSSHSHQGFPREMLGSVTERVIELSPRPVLVVPIRSDAFDALPPKRIVMPLDGSRLAESAVPAVERLARLCSAEIVLLQVIQPPQQSGPLTLAGQLTDHVTAEEMDSLARHEPAVAGVKEREHFEIGDPAGEIIGTADADQSSLIALTTRGRTGLDSPVASPVAMAVIRRSNVPVLVFGREALRRLMAGRNEAVGT